MAEPADSLPQPRGSWRRTALKYALVLPVCLLALVALGAWVLDTSIGHRLLVEILEGTDIGHGVTLQIGRINGSVYRLGRLEDVALRDDRGVFMRIGEIKLDWRPMALLDRKIDIRQVVARRAIMLRQPHLGPGDPNAPLLPSYDVRIDQLAIERMMIARAALGDGTERRVDLVARVNIARHRAHVQLRGRLGGADKLDALLDVDEGANRFNLALNYDAPAGGVLASFAGAKVSRRLRIGGRGDWSNWTGALLADADGHRSAALLLTQTHGQLGLAGQVWTASLLGDTSRNLVGPMVGVWGRGHLAEGALSGRLGLTSARGGLGVSGRAVLNAPALDHVTLALKAGNGLPIGQTSRLDGGELHAVLDGPLAALRVDWQARAGHVGTATSALAGVVAHGRAQRLGTRWTVPVDLTAQKLLTGDASVDPQLVDGRAHATLIFAGAHVSSDDVRVAWPRLSAAMMLRGDTAGGAFALSGEARARGWPVGGIGPVDARAGLTAALKRGSGWSVGGTVTGAATRLANTTLAKLAGDSLRFSGRITAGAGQKLVVAAGAVNGERLRLAFTGRQDGAGRLVYSGSGTQETYGGFSGSLAMVQMGLQGDVLLADPVPAVGMKQVHLVVTPDKDAMAINVEGQSMFGPFAGDLGLALPSDAPARLDVRHFSIYQTAVSGALVLGGGVAGDLALAGGGVKGSLHFAPREEGQGLDATLDIKQAHFGGDQPLTIGQGHIEAHGALLKRHNTIDAKATLQGIGKGRLFVGKMAVAVQLVDGNGKVTAQLTGRRGSRFDLQTLADIGPGQMALLARGTFGSQSIAMPRRAVLTAQLRPDGTTEGWRLAPTELDFAGGRMVGEGLIGNGTVDLRLGLDAMPLALADVVFADLGLGGKVSGQFNWQQGRDETPVGEARVLIKGLTRSSLLLTSRPVDVALVSRLGHDALEMRAVASEGAAQRGKLQARISDLTGSGTLSDRLIAGNLFGQLRYDGPADALWRLMALKTFDLTGPIALAADLTGSIANPHIKGSAASDALRLQSALTGTDIQQIVLRGGFDGSRLTLASLAGHTAGNGVVEGSGALDFGTPNGAGPAIDIRLSAKKAALVARPDMALTATGPMRIVSDGLVGTIAGRLHVDAANWRLGRAASTADLPVIETHEINRRVDIAPTTDHSIPWSFLVDAAGAHNIRLVGLGLDSQWGADIHLRGSVEDPSVSGRADLVEGGYEFAGKRFDLAHGRITLDGAMPTDPKLDIGANAAITGYTATIAVRGSALKPEISFTSTPALPEEELLARLLFGDSITQISAPEAVQLGAALASLHGGGGLDPINKLRSAIGLDRLRIVSADPTLNRQTGVAVGKYLGHRFYAELVSDGRGYSASNLEFRLTNWLALLGSVSTVGRQSINAKISHDY